VFFVMFASRRWMRFALFCNLLGTLLIFLSFQAVSSDVKLLSSNGRTALCAYGEAVVVSNNSNVAVAGHCPDWPQSRATPLLTVEHPRTAILGFSLMLLGFFLQWFALPIARENG
jgi:hypothetical protein